MQPLPTPSALHLRGACSALRAGGVVAYPTEAVWGLGCDPLNRRAVERLLLLKQRDWRQGLILIGADFEQLEPFVQMPSRTAQKRAFSTWPGPATWVFPASDATPMWISGARANVAIRVTAHPVARALCETFGGALVSTSANRSGRPPAISATQIRLAFRRSVDAIVPGPLGGRSAPTTIRDVISGMILRR